MELYQKIYVNPSFLETQHGEIPCEECHGGNPKDDNWQTAHDKVVKDPSFLSAERVCGDCHTEIVESATKSLHYTLKPIFAAIQARADTNPGIQTTLKKSMQKHCGTCHASCGQCHVSRPDYVKGGFLAKHHFKKTPPMDTTCASCHGGRVYGEFTGINRRFKPDTHFEDEEMTCMNCHNAREMHAKILKTKPMLFMARSLPARYAMPRPIKIAFHAMWGRTKKDCRFLNVTKPKLLSKLA